MGDFWRCGRAVLSMDRLPAFDTLRSDDDVAFAESTARHDPTEFDYWRRVDGAAVLGVPSADGGVLLMDGAHGWRLPFVAVDGDDWVAIARASVEALTDVHVDIERAERVERVEHLSADGDERTVTHDVVVRTTPVDEGSLAADPRLPDWGRLTVDWFDAVPEDAYRDHPETVADIERILD